MPPYDKHGITPFVSSVLLVGIILVSTLIVMNSLNPMIAKGKETADLSNAKQSLSSVDRALQELLYEAPGAKRTVMMKVSEGRFVVYSKDDTIRYRLKTTYPLMEAGSITKEGNMILTYGPGIRAYEADIDSDGNMDLIMENDAVLFAVRKLHNSSNMGFINTTSSEQPLITALKNKRLGINMNAQFGIFINDLNDTSYGEGFTELIDMGEQLPGATIRLYLNATDNPEGITYETFFRLLPGQDYVEIEVKAR